MNLLAVSFIISHRLLGKLILFVGFSKLRVFTADRSRCSSSPVRHRNSSIAAKISVETGWVDSIKFSIDLCFLKVLKIIEGKQQHVLAWATSFSREADSHLVCVQDPDTAAYQSQIVCADGQARNSKRSNCLQKQYNFTKVFFTVTGATFVVFNACLKETGARPRAVMTEDGLMIQMRAEPMEVLIEELKRGVGFL